MNKSTTWMKATLYLAGLYNITWGTIVVVFPLELFSLAEMQAPRYPELFQCIGMMISVYGVANIAAAHNPIRYWPVVLAGFLGRVLGPIGFAIGLYKGTFTPAAGITIITNDLIWLIPFGIILYGALKETQHQSS